MKRPRQRIDGALLTPRVQVDGGITAIDVVIGAGASDGEIERATAEVLSQAVAENPDLKGLAEFAEREYQPEHSGHRVIRHYFSRSTDSEMPKDDID